MTLSALAILIPWLREPLHVSQRAAWERAACTLR